MKSSRTRSALGVRREFLVELPAVEPELLGVPMEVALLEVLLILVEEVVHLPELLPRRRRLGGLRRLLGVRVRGRDRKVAEHEPEPVLPCATAPA
jgi:hypothetical protein